MAVIEAPTTEIGTPFATASAAVSYPRGFGTGAANPHWELLEDSEYAPDWKWPNSRTIVDKMRTDSQVNGLWMGMTLPIRRYRYQINPNGSRKKVYEKLADDLNLPIKGKEQKKRGRTKRRFSHDDHLYHALLGLAYGFMMMEQVGEVDDDLYWRLRKLAPRMPFSIEKILAAKDGGLAGIKQNGIQEPLDVGRLVCYPWQKEGANWYGRSMFRPMYKNWFIKDKLIRVDLIKHERNGMGVPTAKATDPDATPQQLAQAQRIVTAWRAGQGSGVSLPYGTDVDLKGVTGSLPDTLASIKYHDESMARSMLMMFMMLGTTSSAGLNGGAVAGTQYDFFTLAQETIALWYCGITNEHVIEDWVDWNFGPDEQAPLIEFVRDFDTDYSVTDLVALIDKGAIHVDPELEAQLRERGGLPPLADDFTAPVVPTPAGDPANAAGTPPGTAQTARTGRVKGNPHGKPIKTSAGRVLTAAELDRIPDRPMRREPTEVEMTAGVDFKTLDLTWQSVLDNLIDEWRKVRDDQIDELTELIADTDDLVELAQVMATVQGGDLIHGELVKALETGVEAALAEAQFQNVEVDDITTDELIDDLESRAEAVATTLTRSLSEVAGRKATQLTGGSLTSKQVADAVREHLESLTDTFLEDQFSGAVTAAQNTGRSAVFDEASPKKIISSEFLDSNTCDPCEEEDGSEYSNLPSAAADYPTGGYKNCLGGTRCRGTLVAVYN